MGNEEAFSWIRQFLEAQQDTEAEDFIKAIKVDLFADEVLSLRPRGTLSICRQVQPRLTWRTQSILLLETVWWAQRSMDALYKLTAI